MSFNVDAIAIIGVLAAVVAAAATTFSAVIAYRQYRKAQQQSEPHVECHTIREGSEIWRFRIMVRNLSNQSQVVSKISLIKPKGGALALKEALSAENLQPLRRMSSLEMNVQLGVDQHRIAGPGSPVWAPSQEFFDVWFSPPLGWSSGWIVMQISFEVRSDNIARSSRVIRRFIRMQKTKTTFWTKIAAVTAKIAKSFHDMIESLSG